MSYKKLMQSFPVSSYLNLLSRGSNTSQDPRLGRGFVYNIGISVKRRIPSPYYGTSRQRRGRPQEKKVMTYIGLTRFSVMKRVEEHLNLARSLGEIDPRKRDPKDIYRGERYTKAYPNKIGAGPLHIAMRMSMGTTYTNYDRGLNNVEDISTEANPSLFSLPFVESNLIGNNLHKPKINNYYEAIIMNKTLRLNQKEESGYAGITWSTVAETDIIKAAYIYLTEEANQSFIQSFLEKGGEKGRELQATRLFSAFYKVNTSFLKKNSQQLAATKRKIQEKLVEIAIFEEQFNTVIETEGVRFKHGGTRKAILGYERFVKKTRTDHTAAIQEAIKDFIVKIEPISLYNVLTQKMEKAFPYKKEIKEAQEIIEKVRVITDEGVEDMLFDFLSKKVVEDVNMKVEIKRRKRKK